MMKLEANAQGTIVPILAQAGARRTGVGGVHDGALRVAVAVTPENGKANKAIIQVLRTSFNIPKQAIELLSGATSRKKRFLLGNLSPEQIRASLEKLAGESKV